MLARTITSLTCIGVAVALLALMAASIVAVYFHIQFGRANDATIPLITVFITLLLALFFGLPSARAKLIRGTFSPLRRVVFLILSVAAFPIVFAMMSGIIARPNSHLSFSIQPEVLANLSIALACGYVMTFLLPGFAYRDLRRLRQMTEANSGQQQQVPQKALDRLTDSYAALGRFDSSQATPFQKLLSTVNGLLLVSVLGAAVYGLAFAQFISSEAHVASVKEYMHWMALAFGCVLFINGMLMPRTRGRGPFANPTVRNMVILILLVPFSYMTVPAAQSGGPALLSLTEDGPYDRITVVVIQRGKARGWNVCDNRATVRWEKHNRQLCNVPDYIWTGLEPGQKLELAGWRTPYGFRYEAFKRLP